MFDGTPLLSPGHPNGAVPWVAFGAIWLGTLLLRHLFKREWTWTGYAFFKPRLLWGRSLSESGKTAGMLASHFMGIMPFGILLWAHVTAHAAAHARAADSSSTLWGQSIGLPAAWVHAWANDATGWSALVTGLALGVMALGLRLMAALVGGWVTQLPEVCRMQTETDRLLRNGLAWAVAAVLLIGFIDARGIPDATWCAHAVGWVWCGFLALKWVRLLQLIRIQSIPIGWGIAYLCTVEIVPTGLLAMGILAAGN